MLSNHKFRIFILTTLICSTQSIYAKKTELERANSIAESIIGLFSEAQNQDQIGIQLAAAIDGISEAEVIKNRDPRGEKASAPSEKILELLKKQFSAEDFQVVAPVFERQMSAQATFYKSCKPNGKIIQTKQSFEVPLICDIPTVNFDKIEVPEQKAKESNAQFAARSLNIMVDAMLKSAKAPFKTSILIHKMADQFTPEMDDNQYFPNSVTNKITGSTEEELDTSD